MPCFERARKCLKEVKSIFSANKHLLRISNGESLINTLWHFNLLHFDRGYGKHRQMCWGDVQAMKDAGGAEYLHFSERQAKTRHGTDHLISDQSGVWKPE